MEKKINKLLIFVPQFPVLSETFIEREASELVKLNQLDVSIVSLEPGSGVLSDNLQDKVYYERISLKTCFSAFLSYVLLHPNKVLNIHSLISGADEVPYFLNFEKDNGPRSNLSVLGRFHKSRLIHFLKGIAYAKIFEKYQPDHIHAHFLSDNSTVAMVAAKILDIPFSISAHAKDVFIERSLIPVKAREAKFISVCNGNTWKEVVKFANATKSSGKVKLLFHGIDSSKFFSGETPEKPLKPFIFTVGRLVEKKGHEYLIRASRLLVDAGVDHIVKIAGGGPLYTELSDLVKELKLSDHVEILGNETDGVPNAVIAGYLKVADIFSAAFIHASDGDVDGVPTTVIEASLAKLPIVATDSGSMTDLITPHTGLIVKQKDPKELAKGLKTLIENPSLRDDLSNKAYEQAKKQFDIEKNITQLQALILA